MKKFLPALLASLFTLLLVITTIHGVEAQSFAGDDRCGSSAATKCTPEDLRRMMRNVVAWFVGIAVVCLAAIILFRLVAAWFAQAQGKNPYAIKEAGKAAFNTFVGFGIMVLVAGGFLYMLLEAFGTKPEFLKILQFFSSSIIESAYAAEGFKNPLGSNNLYDIIISGVSLILRFFIYPAIIAMWVWSGFQFVYAQGRPEELKKAKAWVLWAFIITIVAFAFQGFILAFKGTAERIAPGTTSSIQSGSDGRGQPAAGAVGSSCTTSGGAYGTIGTDGECYAGGRR